MQKELPKSSCHLIWLLCPYPCLEPTRRQRAMRPLPHPSGGHLIKGVSPSLKAELRHQATF